MNVKNLFIVNAIVAIVFGLAFVLVPGQTADVYDVTVGDGGIFIGRLFGATLVTFAVLTWLVKDAQATAERQAIMLGLFIGDVIGFVVSLIAQLNEIANGLGWITVAIYLILALAFGYFRFMASEEGMPQASPSM